MHQVIVYLQESGRPAVVWPTPEVLQNNTVEQVAICDVPRGRPFKIMDAERVPKTHEARALWVIPASELTDGVGTK